jgi:hypothetical protein
MSISNLVVGYIQRSFDRIFTSLISINKVNGSMIQIGY